MYPYNPKPFDAMLAAFVCFVFTALAMLVDKEYEKLRTAFWVAAFFFGVIAAVITLRLIFDGINSLVNTQIDWMEKFSSLDDEAREAVAFQFPAIRYRMKHGQVREFFEDTNATAEHFRLFLQTSTEKQTSPLRNWSTTEQPAWAWNEIKSWLQARGYILEDSYAGNHSWLWRGNSYRHLMAYWKPGRKLENFNIGTEAVYEEGGEAVQ